MSTTKPAGILTDRKRRRPWRPSALGLGLTAIVAVVLVLTFLVIIVVDESVLSARFERAASELLDMDVRMEGAVNLRIVPYPHIRATRVRATRDSSRVIEFESVKLHIALAPLIRGEARIRHAQLTDGRILVVRAMDGRLNFQPREIDPAPETSLPSIAFANTSLTYIDERAETQSELAGCDGDLHGIARVKDDSPEGLAGLDFDGEFRCDSIGHDDLVFHDVAVTVRATNGRFEFDPISLKTFGGAGEARFAADLSGDSPRVELEISLDDLQLDEFLQLLQDDARAEGTMTFAANLSASGDHAAGMRNTLDGDISIYGRELNVHGIDVDRRLADFGATQTFSMLDVAAVIFAGPAGLAFTKSADYAKLLTTDDGSTMFREAVSRWKISNGVAEAIDVAAATDVHRIAAYGSINFAERTFDGLMVALLDRRGCAPIEQAVTGSFSDPKIKQPNLLETLLGPLVDILERGIDALTDEECEVVYDGIIAAP